MRKWIERVFTHTELRRKGRSRKLEKVEIPPSERFVYFMEFVFLSLVCLVALQAIHLIALQTWNSEIFAAITSLIGTIVGCFVGAKA